jgi:hypothetical protein
MRPDLLERIIQTFQVPAPSPLFVLHLPGICCCRLFPCQAELCSKLLERAPSARHLLDTLCVYSTKVTKATREMMEKDFNAQVPADKKLFPGQLDHAAGIAMLVGGKPVVTPFP